VNANLRRRRTFHGLDSVTVSAEGVNSNVCFGYLLHKVLHLVDFGMKRGYNRRIGLQQAGACLKNVSGEAQLSGMIFRHILREKAGFFRQ